MAGTQTILQAARDALRITGDTFDSEIELLIAAARIALVNSGVLEDVANDDSNAAVRLAIIVYVRANFGIDNPDSEKLQKAFDSMATQLKLTSEYGQVLEDEQV